MFNLMNFLAISTVSSESGLSAEEIAQQAQELQDKKTWLAILIVLLVVELIFAVVYPRVSKNYKANKEAKAARKAKRKAQHSKKK